MDASQLPSIVELWFFSIAHWCFPFFWAAFAMPDHVSGHKFSGLWWLLEFLVSRTPSHRFPFGGFSYSGVNFVNPVRESDKLRSTSTFQESSVRLPCNTSKFVCVVLVTSTYFSGSGNVPSFGTWSWTRGSTWWRQVKCPSVDQKSLRTSASSFLSSTGWDFSTFPEGLLWDLHSLEVGPALERILELHSLSFRQFLLFHLRLGICFYHFLALLFPLHWAFGHGFLIRPNFPAPQCLQPIYILTKFPSANNAYPRSIPFKTFLTKLVEPWLVLRGNRMIFNHCVKRNDQAFNLFLKSHLQWGRAHFADNNSIP